MSDARNVATSVAPVAVTAGCGTGPREATAAAGSARTEGDIRYR